MNTHFRLFILFLVGLLATANAEDPVVFSPEDIPPDYELAADNGDSDPYYDFDDLFDDEFDEYDYTVISDPFESWNRAVFTFNDGFYTHLLIPVSRAYSDIIPDPVETGISNFFDNLKFPVRVVSHSLQGNFDLAGRETGRFLLDSTVGLGGFLKPSAEVPALANLPGSDLGLVLASWGFDHGPYLVLPLLGPSSTRDLAGRVGGIYLNPVYHVSEVEWALSLRSLEILNDSPELMRNYRRMQEAALDPYSATRDFYVQFRKRQNERIDEYKANRE